MSVFERVSEAATEVDYDTLADWLLSEGIDGTATIVQMQATGRSVDERPELLFELVLSVGYRQSTVNHVQPIPTSLIGRLRSGAQVPVKVDPEDHSRLIIGPGG